MKPLVFISGPYTHPDPVWNTRSAVLAGLSLYKSELVVPLIPHLTLLAHAIEPHGVDFWYQLDLDQLAHCDALLRLPGESVGADAEAAFAKEHAIPVFEAPAPVLVWAINLNKELP